MRKLLIAALALGTLVPMAAQAQSAHEVRESARNVRHDERDLRDAQRYGDRRDVREAREDLHDSRREQREDWRDYKRSHREAFRRPGYVGPRGYVYRPVAVGHRFDRSYYGGRYVISNYRAYRLPAPQARTSWVRYGNDVVLVNTRTGRVLRVYNGFFG